MLKLTIPKSEFYDERKNEFIQIKETAISLEHSLVSISKWESKFQKAFLDPSPKTTRTAEEILEYIKCMTLTPNVDEKVYFGLTRENIKQIKDYIDSPMTATTFRNVKDSAPSRRKITSEEIYAKMIEHGIPFECQKWHINRLLTLIRICDIRQGPQKKMSKSEIFAQNRELNAARRAAMNSKG